jgi:hypothetical protein
MHAQVPQLWQGIAEHLAEASPEVVVLIHPINMTSSHSNRSLQVIEIIKFCLWRVAAEMPQSCSPLALTSSK